MVKLNEEIAESSIWALMKKYRLHTKGWFWDILVTIIDWLDATKDAILAIIMLLWICLTYMAYPLSKWIAAAKLRRAARAQMNRQTKQDRGMV